MTILPILIAPHPTLRKKATKVVAFDDALHILVDNMLETMYEASGIGLAAPQIGVSQQILVMDCSERTDNPTEAEDPVIMINPRVRKKFGDFEPYDEGCLSLPGYEITVERQCHAEIDYQDIHGQTHSGTFEGLEARCALHEIDHLNGTMIIDHTSQLRRSKILRELRNKKQKDAKDHDQ